MLQLYVIDCKTCMSSYRVSVLYTSYVDYNMHTALSQTVEVPV